MKYNGQQTVVDFLLDIRARETIPLILSTLRPTIELLESDQWLNELSRGTTEGWHQASLVMHGLIIGQFNLVTNNKPPSLIEKVNEGLRLAFESFDHEWQQAAPHLLEVIAGTQEWIATTEFSIAQQAKFKTAEEQLHFRLGAEIFLFSLTLALKLNTTQVKDISWVVE